MFLTLAVDNSSQLHSTVTLILVKEPLVAIW